ncbi:hypothetical protein NPIL_443101 [Nephila pilipes]|uniref:Uncharacterized protein n=1 Tax=Nephila pilipes TaxID=299642 RepID=A0A8X6NLY0_NEPPI|nr:hypothetical protein NPIL_443101 [Nephila pilipes]
MDIFTDRLTDYPNERLFYRYWNKEKECFRESMVRWRFFLTVEWQCDILGKENITRVTAAHSIGGTILEETVPARNSGEMLQGKRGGRTREVPGRVTWLRSPKERKVLVDREVAWEVTSLCTKPPPPPV